MKIQTKLLIPLLALFVTGCMTISTNGEYTLQNGRTLRGDLIMTSGETTLEEGSRVTGNVIMTSGTLNVDGQVDGDIIYSSAKSINLGPRSVVGGDIKGTSGDVYRMEGSQIGGEIIGDHAFTLSSDFFAKVFGLLCGVPLALIGSVVYLFSNRRKKVAEAGGKLADFGTPDIPAKLKQLKQMRDDGLINDDDFEAKKVDVLKEL